MGTKLKQKHMKNQKEKGFIKITFQGGKMKLIDIIDNTITKIRRK